MLVACLTESCQVGVCKGRIGCEINRIIRFKCEESAFNPRACVLGVAMERRRVTFYKADDHIYGLTTQL